MVEKGTSKPSEEYYIITKLGYKDWELPMQALANAKARV